MMTDESPPKSRSPRGKIILPQAVEDKSLIDSFTGFIQDVVPQACGGAAPIEIKEKILWARFEYTDLNDPIFYSDVYENITASSPPILLILGYSYGIQIWSIGIGGEATELLTWNQGLVKILKLVPSPQTKLDQKSDSFVAKRPLVALCDGNLTGSQFCSINFITLRTGELVKSIKFKNQALDILVNRVAIIISFVGKIAVFSAATLENQQTLTTCYICPGMAINTVALGSRWMAYCEQKITPWLKSMGGAESEQGQSYTATVLSAAKTLGQGLRDLSGTVANSLSGNMSTSPSANIYGSPPNNTVYSSGLTPEATQSGIVTIVDLLENKKSDEEDDDQKVGIVAHFNAHYDPIVKMCFDPSGMLLLTADKRGHRFNLFRIQPHILGSSNASIHHIYVLYRGDTTAHVQDMAFSNDSRWVAVSSSRGTTHVFPITPYGGPIGLRTHSTPHVVNKLSRFHRSAGIIHEGRNSPGTYDSWMLSSSPTSLLVCGNAPGGGGAAGGGSGGSHFPPPIVVTALAQLRSHSILMPQTRHASPHGQDENSQSTLKMVACFAAPRAIEGGALAESVAASLKKAKCAVDSLFIMSSQGTLMQYDLEPFPANGAPKEKLGDDTPIELKVDAKIKWFLLQACHSSSVMQPPLDHNNPILATYASMRRNIKSVIPYEKSPGNDENWLSQVEIVTHVGPHRRIWMGPQFVFKPFLKDSDEPECVEFDTGCSPKSMPASTLPNKTTQNAAILPLFIESSSNSSLEHSPRLIETYVGDSDSSLGTGELKIQEDLADAMLESPIHSLFKQELSDTENVEEFPEKQQNRKARKVNKKKKK